MSLHIELADALERQFSGCLQGHVQQNQDALHVRLDNGVALTIRYAAPDSYSLRWSWGELNFGIDTAPLHHGLQTFPNHLHHADGRTLPDPVTQPARAPFDNVAQLIRALLRDPTLATLAPG